MSFSKKMTPLFESKSNVIKLIILLITLFIIYRIFTTDINDTHSKTNNNIATIENFTSMIIPYYGNVITLNNNTNDPIRNNNQYIFNLSKSYRIDCLVFRFTNNNILNISVKYKYGNNDYKFLKNEVSEGSPPTFKLDSINRVLINNIITENNTLVYTSQIMLIINTKPSLTSELDSYGIFGGDRKLLTQTNYNNKTKTDDIKDFIITKPNASLINYNDTNNITKYTYNLNQENDNMKIYCIQVYYKKINTYNTYNVDINIEYENNIYPLDIFNIKQTYKIRCDDYSINKYTNTKSIYIILDEPIIANKLILSSNIIQSSLVLDKIIINGNVPNREDINEYKKTVNLIMNKNNSLETNICPSINELVEKQNKTQEICDNLEYQDKIKSEKIRLERNKQYLLKLKTQQEQISDLNKVIHELEDKREARSTTADQIRVLQYQKQKGDASTIRDLANQRLESQDNNKLFMDLNLNYTN